MSTTVKRLRLVAVAAIATTVAVLYLAGAGRHVGLPVQPWWYDTSRVEGAALEQRSSAATPDQWLCLLSGGQPIAGTCAHWNEAIYPDGTIGTPVAVDTISAPGASIVNDTTPATIGGLPPSAVWIAVALLLIAGAVAIRSTLGATLALIALSQGWKSHSRWVNMFSDDQGPLPALEPTTYLNLYRIVTQPVAAAVVIPAGLWLITSRFRQLKQNLRSGNRSETVDRVRDFAATVLKTSTPTSAGSADPRR